MSSVQVVQSPEAHTIHTPFLRRVAGEVQLFCAAGVNSRTMDILELSAGAKPKLRIRANAFDARSVCGPWLVGDSLYCSAYYAGNNGFTISRFELSNGEYSQAEKFAVTREFPCDSPCVVDDTMYFVCSGLEIYSMDMRTLEYTAVCIPASTTYSTEATIKPNVFRVGADQLCAFVTEIDTAGGYHVAVFSIRNAVWERVAELLAAPSSAAFSYKPFLFKGNLVTVEKDTSHFSRNLIETSWLRITPIDLSLLWGGFTAYPILYNVPLINADPINYPSGRDSPHV